MKKYNKLVRDKIPEIMEKNGEKANFHTAEDNEYKKAIHRKLTEEVEEFLENESISDIADILEVLKSIQKLYNYSDKDIEKIRSEKAEKMGAFEKRIVLEKTKKKRGWWA